MSLQDDFDMVGPAYEWLTTDEFKRLHKDFVRIHIAPSRVDIDDAFDRCIKRFGYLDGARRWMDRGMNYARYIAQVRYHCACAKESARVEMEAKLSMLGFRHVQY